MLLAIILLIVDFGLFYELVLAMVAHNGFSVMVFGIAYLIVSVLVLGLAALDSDR